jgi:hypothetical protein
MKLLKSYIEKVGVEMEGGWNYKPDNLKYDQSVEVESMYRGEVSSPPTSYENLQYLFEWMRKWYPQHVDASCGFHIHISLKNTLYYSQLMSEEFYEYFLQKTEEWGKKKEEQKYDMSLFWKRWRGDNKFCRRIFRADEQSIVKDKQSCRYSHLNFCYTMHQTLECRLFPMFQSKRIAN